jgi:integrase/recombinase XerD
MVTVQKILHRDKTCIFLKCQGDEDTFRKIKNLPDAKYSRTHGCWYIPYEKEHWHYFTKTGLDYVIDSSGAAGSAMPLRDNTGKNIADMPENGNQEAADTVPISIRYKHPFFFIRHLPCDCISSIKNLQGAYWNHRYQNWVIPANQSTIENLWKSIQIISEEQYHHWVNLIGQVEDPPTCIMYSSPEHPNHVLVQLKGHQVDVEFMKHVPERSYNKDGKYWLIPDHEEIIQRLSDHYTAKNTKVILRIKFNFLPKNQPSRAALKKYYLAKSNPGIHYATVPYLDTLIAQQYSVSTIREYYTRFAKFITDILPATSGDIKVEDVNEYLCKLSERNVSESLLNSYINAIKFYYEKVVFKPDWKIDRIKRPRKGHYLPKVLSVQQVDAMLRASANLKHTAILYALYGHGIRLDEMLSLRLEDLLWDRNQIFVHHGKGKKDRYIPMSQEFKALMQWYIHEYKPRFWLFEGQDQKNQYSSRSVQAVVKNAAKRAGIPIKVTPHMLRHSYATHLVDVGTQLPYVKELLGHKDIKTTMIYTHVTNSSIENIISPLDRLRQR